MQRSKTGVFVDSLMNYSTWLLFIGIYLVIGIFIPTMLTASTFQNVVVQGTTVCLLAFGMTFVMLVGHMDVSIVSIAAAAPMVGVLLMEKGVPAYIAIIVVLLTGVFIGFINGIMITKLKIPSLVQTVAMWWMLSGAVLIITKGEAKTGLPDSWMWPGRIFVGPFPILVILFIVIVIITQIFSRRTVMGRRLYLVGGNPVACKAMGVPVDKVVITAFMISGIFAALSGYFLSARMGFVSAKFAIEWLMPAIAAPVIAGVSLSGGRGNLLNVVAGAYLVQLIVMVVRAGGVGGYATEFVQGVLVFIAILINAIRDKISEKRIIS